MYLLMCGFIADVVSGSEITAKNGYPYDSNVEGKDRSLLAVQSRHLPTVTEQIRTETSLLCLPAKIRTHYLPGHTSEAAANSVEKSLYNSQRKSNKMQQCIKIFISHLHEVQRVSGDTPPIIRSLELH